MFIKKHFKLYGKQQFHIQNLYVNPYTLSKQHFQDRANYIDINQLHFTRDSQSLLLGCLINVDRNGFPLEPFLYKFSHYRDISSVLQELGATHYHNVSGSYQQCYLKILAMFQQIIADWRLMETSSGGFVSIIMNTSATEKC